jgi:hypothetical protein
VLPGKGHTELDEVKGMWISCRQHGLY